MCPYTLVVHGLLIGLLGQTPTDWWSAKTTADVGERHEQAGWPKKVAWWAIPSDTGSYAVYRVGGGCSLSFVADTPLPTEGTWGWDYVGRWWHRIVILGWWHERRDQGGTYRTDGPSLNHGEGTLRTNH